MKAYLLSLGAGILVGVVYNLLGVRSPAPPVIALIGLAGILIGEQALPLVRRAADKTELARFIRNETANHILGRLPANRKGDA